MKPKNVKSAAPKAVVSGALLGSWLKIQANIKQREFDGKAKELVWQLTEGGGSKNIHVLDTIRSLEWAYLAMSSLKMAVEYAKAQQSES